MCSYSSLKSALSAENDAWWLCFEFCSPFSWRDPKSGTILQLTEAHKNLSLKHPDMSLQDTETKVSKTLTQLLETDRGVTGGGMKSASLPFHQSTKMGPFCKAKAIMAGQIFLPIDLLYHFYLYSCNEKVVYAWLLVTQ